MDAMANWAMLDAIARQGVHSMGDVARVLRIDEAEAARLVDEAEREGLLTRTRPELGQAGELALTPSGREQWDHLNA
jgi:DNA-binding MarR family transcriptional regulator